VSSHPVSRTVDARQREPLAALFRARGLTLQQHAKNVYLAWEARTSGRSIFSLYTSGKFVSTVRAGDAEGLLLEDEVAQLLGAAPGGAGKAPRGQGGGAAGAGEPGAAGAREPGAGVAPASDPLRVASPTAAPDTLFLAGADETGTGELLGSAVLGAAHFPLALVPELQALVGRVETKSSRAASGWERLGQQLQALRGDGLHLALLSIPNRLFDRYSKNALLDLAYVRLVGDLLAAAGQPAAEVLARTELALDDYGTGALLGQARAAWVRRGLQVQVATRADVRWLASRTASVAARACRAREMEGLRADVTDGPLGTGNAGNPATLAWLRRRRRSGAGWPGFVKTSFRTVTELDGLPATTKESVPPLRDLLDEASAGDFLAGRLDVRRARLRAGAERSTQRLELPARGHRPHAADAFLPLLCGGAVLDLGPLPLELLDALLEREDGLLSGWRLLVGPGLTADNPTSVALARAHARGVVQVVPTDEPDPLERAARHAGLLVVASGSAPGLHVVVR